MVGSIIGEGCYYQREERQVVQVIVPACFQSSIISSNNETMPKVQRTLELSVFATTKTGK